MFLLLLNFFGNQGKEERRDAGKRERKEGNSRHEIYCCNSLGEREWKRGWKRRRRLEIKDVREWNWRLIREKKREVSEKFIWMLLPLVFPPAKHESSSLLYLFIFDFDSVTESTPVMVSLLETFLLIGKEWWDRVTLYYASQDLVRHDSKSLCDPFDHKKRKERQVKRT